MTPWLETVARAEFDDEKLTLGFGITTPFESLAITRSWSD
jgi:hypothetical protein